MKDSEIMTIKEVAKYLKMNERTVYRLIQDGKIPASKIGKQWRLNKERINEELGFQISEFGSEYLAGLEKDHKEETIKITPLLKESNIVFDLMASNKNEAIKILIENLVTNSVITSDQGKKIHRAVIERERLCSTAIGEGVAIPHPRQVVSSRLKKPLISLGICKRGMDFESIDGSPTKLIFLISAPREDIHLKLMARLSRLLRDKKFGYKLSYSNNYKELKELLKEKEDNIKK